MNVTKDFHQPAHSLANGILIASLFFLAGCSGLVTHYDVMKTRASDYVTSHPNLNPGTANAIRSNRVMNGMSKQEVMAAWGRPVMVRKSHRGRFQVWYFGCGWPHHCAGGDEETDQMPEEIYQSQVVFENGRAVSQQN